MTKPLLSFEKEIAARAREIILSDLSVYDTIPDLAIKVSTNPYTLQRVFKIAYGMSVPAFSRLVRIEEAKRLLQTTSDTLVTIGTIVGYAEGSVFQEAFKEVVGIPPGEWRRKPG